MRLKLGRIVLYTKRVEAMSSFYSKHFGFEVRQDEGDRITELRSLSHGFILMLHPAGKAQKEGQVLVKLVFDVEDVQSFCETCRKNGLDFGPIHKADGYEFANAKDPSKNAISVSSRAFRRE